MALSGSHDGKPVLPPPRFLNADAGLGRPAREIRPRHAFPAAEAARAVPAGGRETPFATIHRWFVADGEGGPDVEVLVVEKVGQVHGREGCAVGYVVATGNADANGKARRIADRQARDFACGDQPTVDAGSVALPDFVRENE